MSVESSNIVNKLFLRLNYSVLYIYIFDGSNRTVRLIKTIFAVLTLSFEVSRGIMKIIENKRAIKYEIDCPIICVIEIAPKFMIYFGTSQINPTMNHFM